jgi:hypothetical protein
MDGTVDVEETISLQSGLGRPMPNPARTQVTLPFALARSGGATVRARIVISDVSGRLIRTLADGGDWAPGSYTIHWNGRDATGRRVPSGVYFARLLVSGRAMGESRSIVWLSP